VAKKKRKRRPPPRPAQAPQEGSARALRKEEARKEREARIRRARRRVLLRRLSRVGIVVVVAGLIAGFIYIRSGEDRRIREAAAQAAQRLDCGEAQDLQDEGNQHLAAGEAPPEYGTNPATSGRHNASPLPPEPAVYDQPFDVALEAQAVHNLEHGYVIMYYRQDGDGAVPQPTVDALADLANGEDQVLLAPYAELPEGESLAFAAWTHLQTCPPVTAETTDDVVAVARGFINRFKDSSDAPEAPAL
jgi:hypothetical protein